MSNPVLVAAYLTPFPSHPPCLILLGHNMAGLWTKTLRLLHPCRSPLIREMAITIGLSATGPCTCTRIAGPRPCFKEKKKKKTPLPCKDVPKYISLGIHARGGRVSARGMHIASTSLPGRSLPLPDGDATSPMTHIARRPGHSDGAPFRLLSVYADLLYVRRLVALTEPEKYLSVAAAGQKTIWWPRYFPLP